MSAFEQAGDGSFRIIAIERPFENLVALHVWWPGNHLNKRFPLNLLLEVEEHHLSLPQRPNLLRRIGHSLSAQTDAADQALRLRVRLRYCYIRCRSSAIEIVGESKYESAILAGTYETCTSRKSLTTKTSGVSAGLGGKATLKPAEANASLGIHGGADFAGKQQFNIESTTTTKPDIYEVQAVPNGWRIGHSDYGDPNKLLGCLDGRYFDRPVPGIPQTCEAEFHEGQNRGELTFTVTVRDGIHVEQVGNGNASRDEKAEAFTLMRNKIAALRIERHLDQISDGKGLVDGELPIALVKCEVVRAVEEKVAMASPPEPGDATKKDPQIVRSKRKGRRGAH
jgi:hypothetical protein